MRLSLRRKIVGGFGSLLLLIALLGWVTLSLFNSLRSVQSRVFDEAIPGLVAVNEIVRAYSAQSGAIRGFLISSQQSDMARYRNAASSARYWETQAVRLFGSGRERRYLDRIISSGERFRAIVDNDVIPLARGGRRTLAFTRLEEADRLHISPIETTGELLRNVQGSQVTASERSVRTRTTQAVVIFLVVVLAALALGVAIAVILPRRLELNISKLMHAVRAIGRGDFNQDPQIRSGDEIEELAGYFKDMQAGLVRLRQLVAQDRELEIAAAIQQNLLQRELPQVPGVSVVHAQKQANLVGGDWYDVEAGAGSLSIVVGDASGKGIGAALIATVALSVLRGERRLGAVPSAIIGRANEALREVTDPDSFTTLLFVTVELDTGVVRWLNMGHPAPFLVRPATAAARVRGYFVEGPRNRALGWFEHPGSAEAVMQLEPGDRLVLFTDGFLEAKSPSGDPFGEERLGDELVRTAALAPDGVADELLRRVETFAAGKLDDDLTVLILEFQGAAALGGGVPTRVTGEEPWHSRR